MKISNYFNNFSIAAVLNFLFPKFCVNCGFIGDYLCKSCMLSIKIKKKQECPICRKNSFLGYICCHNKIEDKTCNKDKYNCDEKYSYEDFHFDQLLVASSYDKNSILKKLLIMFKYKFSTELGEIFAGVFRKLCHELDVNFDDFLIVPVPLDSFKLLQRGFNQSELIAKSFGNVCDCLQRKIHKIRQADLGRLERLENLKGLFSLKNGFDLYNKKVLLIDDVATTCSTLNECSKILKNAGVSHICAVVLARGKYKSRKSYNP